MTSVRVIHTSTCPNIGPVCAERDEPPQLHDQRFNVAELRMTAAYGLWRWLGIELQVPLKVNRTTIDYQRLDGRSFEPDYELIHHRNETLFGIGDPWMLLRSERRLGLVTVGARLGASLPLGSTEADPFELGDMGLRHQHIQFGAGTIAPVASLGVLVRLGPKWLVTGHGQMQLFVARNQQGYQPGNRFSVGASAQRAFGALAISGGVDLAVERSERWGGQVLQDGNLGRTDVLAGIRATYRIGSYGVGVGVKVPAYQHIVTAGDESGQLSYPAIIDLSLERGFDLSR
jgi:hypothetical protein